MPESCRDRFSKKHEFFFFFVKQPKYYFDLDGVREKIKPQREFNPLGKNPGDVSDFWDIPTQPSSDKHYATYNFNLIDKPIIAGCPKDGVILDPFCGTGTTVIRAIQLGRKATGIDGSQEYCDIANKRIEDFNKQTVLEL